MGVGGCDCVCVGVGVSVGVCYMNACAFPRLSVSLDLSPLGNVTALTLDIHPLTMTISVVTYVYCRI